MRIAATTGRFDLPKKMRGWALVLAATALALFLVGCSEEEDAPSARISAVQFPDPNMEACAIASGAVFTSSVTAIDCVFFSIVDVRGIENFTELTSANFGVNSITDLAPFAGLTKLKFLSVAENNGNLDLTPLSGLTALESLELQDNFVFNLAALSTMTSLIRLNLNYNGLPDVNFLSGLANLVILNLAGVGLADLTPIAGLTQLRGLELQDNNSFTDISPLAALVNLQTLDLSDEFMTGVIATGVPSLSTLTAAQFISLEGNPAIPCPDVVALRAALPTAVVFIPACP